MLLYQDFIKNYLKEAENQVSDNYKKVLEFLKTGKGKVSEYKELAKKLTTDEWKKLLPEEKTFIDKNKFGFYDEKGETKDFDLFNTKTNSIDPRAEFIFGIEDDKTKNNIFSVTKLDQKVLEDLQKKMTTKNKWSFQKAESEYKQLGKILTYNSIDVIYKLGKQEKIAKSDLEYALKNAFKSENADYLKSIYSLDTKMAVDAVAGVLEAASNRDESLVIPKAPTLLEANDIANMKLNEFLNTVKTMSDAEKLDYIQPFINDNQRDFEAYKEKLQNAFGAGSKEIIEKEKSDKEQDFVDPVTNKVEKRVGRLGHYGPMTYIKNHPALNKSIEAIDKQKWNIFNSAAKLLIKFFKFIETGEKKLQEFMNDVRSGKKEIITNIDNMVQKDFTNQMQEIANEQSDDPDKVKANNEKIVKVLLTYCEDVAKYEEKFIEQFGKLNETSLVTFNKDNKTFDINSNVLDFINNTKNNLMNVELGLSKAQDTIKEILNTKTEEPKEETQEQGEGQEAPQQTASYKPVYNNPIIDEADDKTVNSTEEEIKKAGDQSIKDNEKNKDQKKEEPKKEETKPINWQQMKFSFNLQTQLKFGKLEKFYSDGTFGKEAEMYQKMAEKVSDNGLKLYLESFGKLLALFNSKSNNAKILSQDEISTKTITAGELVNKTNALFDTLKNIHHIEAFKDVKIDNMDEIRNEFASIVQEVSKAAEIINDPIILSIGYEKKDDEQNAEPPKEIQQKVNTIDKQIVASLEKLQDKNTKIENTGSVIEQFTKANEELNKLSNNDDMKKFIALAKKKFQKMLEFFLPKVYLYTKFANDGNFSKQIEQQHEAFIEELEPIVLNLNEAQPIDWEAIEKSAVQIMNGIKPMLENPEKDIQQFYNEYTKWVAGVNKLINDLTNRNDFKKEHGKVVDELKKHKDPFYRYLVIFSFLKMKNQNTEENGENKEGQEQSQEGNTEGQAKEGTVEGTPTQKPKKQIDKSNVQDAQLADNFHSELAEELYKYLRG